VILTAPLSELQKRGAALIAAAAAETCSGCDVRWPALFALEDSGALAVRIVEVDGELVGYGVAAAVPALFSSGVTCTTLSVFVLPAHRGRWGRQLLDTLATWAREERGVPLHVQAVPGSRLERLARRLLWRPVAVAFEAV
jgi:GNAT superfamily N-acetyltransferase